MGQKRPLIRSLTIVESLWNEPLVDKLEVLSLSHKNGLIVSRAMFLSHIIYSTSYFLLSKIIRILYIRTSLVTFIIRYPRRIYKEICFPGDAREIFLSSDGCIYRNSIRK